MSRPQTAKSHGGLATWDKSLVSAFGVARVFPSLAQVSSAEERRRYLKAAICTLLTLPQAGLRGLPECHVATKETDVLGKTASGIDHHELLMVCYDSLVFHKST